MSFRLEAQLWPGIKMEKCSDNHGQPPGVHCTSEARVKDCVGAGGGGGHRRERLLFRSRSLVLGGDKGSITHLPLIYDLQENRAAERRFFLQMRSITVTRSCSTFQLKYTRAMFLTIQVCQSDRHWFKWDVSSSAWYSCSPSSRQYVIPLPDITHKHTLHLALVVYMIASEEYIPGNIMYSGWFFFCVV